MSLVDTNHVEEMPYYRTIWRERLRALET